MKATADIWSAWGGIAGVQTLLPVLLTQGRLPLEHARPPDQRGAGATFRAVPAQGRARAWLGRRPGPGRCRAIVHAAQRGPPDQVADQPVRRQGTAGSVSWRPWCAAGSSIETARWSAGQATGEPRDHAVDPRSRCRARRARGGRARGAVSRRPSTSAHWRPMPMVVSPTWPAVICWRGRLPHHLRRRRLLQRARVAQPRSCSRVTIEFEAQSTDRHYHVPLLVSPYACTSYRGS